MSEEGVKTCVSCLHFKGPENYYTAQMQIPNNASPYCEHPAAVTRDPIYGKAHCRAERNNSKGCGPKAKLWASKDSANKG